MALWQKVRKLDPNAVKEVVQVYSANNIPIELRDICAIWIEGSIKFSSAEKFCIGLRKQIQEKLVTLTTSSYAQQLNVPFYITGKLTDFLNKLTTSNAAVLHNIYNSFQTCLETERLLVEKMEKSATAAAPLVSHSVAQAAACGNIARLSTSSTQSTTEPTLDGFASENFLNNPLRKTIDGEMSNILNAVWNLKEYSYNLSIKCHEVKLLHGHGAQPTLNGVSEMQPFTTTSPLTQEIKSKNEIKRIANQIYGKTLEVRNRTIIIINNWNQLELELNKQLSLWATEQKLNANGNTISIKVDRLQNVAEYLMEVAWKLRGFLMSTADVCQAHPALMIGENITRDGSPGIPDLTVNVTSLIKQLAQNTFVVLHQPTQVLKTNTRFHVLPGNSPMEICLLVGEKLSLQLSPPTVTVCLVDEAACKDIHARGLEGDRFKKVMKQGRLFPDSGRLDFCTEKKCSSAVFRQISLKDFFRNGRKGAIGREQAELVTEEKFSLLFRVEFAVGDIEFRAWKLSLPIVITTHGSQESLAWATVTWDNAFSHSDRIPFQLPDYVSWEGVSNALNGRFKCLVGAPLSQENIDYFAERMSIYAGFPDRLTWSELCKNLLPGRKFTLWEWFYEGASLIEQHLKEAWKNGYVKGFIEKEKAENMLCNSGCLPGTFLLRFSESILAGISIVWLHSDGIAYSLAPFKSKELEKSHSIVKAFDQETLHYVYPNVKKEVAFKTYYESYNMASKSEEPVGGNPERYIKFRNQVVIDNPFIPRFRIDNGPSDVVCTQQNDTAVCSPLDANQNQSDPLFDIDIDQLLSVSTQESMEASPSSTYQVDSPWNNLNGERADGNANVGQSDSDIEKENCFYFEL